MYIIKKKTIDIQEKRKLYIINYNNDEGKNDVKSSSFHQCKF